MNTMLLEGSYNPLNIFKVLKHRYDFMKSHPLYFDPEGLLVFSGSQGSRKNIVCCSILY